MGKYFVISFLLAFMFVVAQADEPKVVYCYWGTWSYYRPGDGQFSAENIDPSLCTHIGYSFFGLQNGEMAYLDSWLDIDLGMIKKTVDLKKRNGNLKVIAAIGGWNEGSVKYSEMVSSKENRTIFIKSALKLILENCMDGIDYDWEYPTQRGGSINDKANFITLLKETKEAFEPYNLSMVAAVGAGTVIASESYDIPGLAKYLDFINVMTYDFVGSNDPNTGMNAPLTGEEQDVQKSIEFYIANGAPSNKLVLGIPFYGRTFTLANAADNTPGANSSGPGLAGPYTREAGYLGYNEICMNLQSNNGWTSVWSSKNLVPYAFNQNQWLTYDDVQSISLKVDYVNKMNLRGAMTWSIETDDFHGNCGPKNPLLNTMNNLLKK